MVIRLPIYLYVVLVSIDKCYAFGKNINYYSSGVCPHIGTFPLCRKSLISCVQVSTSAVNFTTRSRKTKKLSCCHLICISLPGDKFHPYFTANDEYDDKFYCLDFSECNNTIEYRTDSSVSPHTLTHTHTHSHAHTDTLMHTHTHTLTHSCTHKHTHTHTHIHTHTHTHTLTHTHRHTHAHTHTHTCTHRHTHAHTHIHTHTHTHTHTDTHTQTHSCTHTHTHMHTQTHSCTHTHTLTHSCTHTHTHTHTHTDTLMHTHTADNTWSHKPVTGYKVKGRRSHCAVSFGSTVLYFGGYNAVHKHHFGDLFVLHTGEGLLAKS